MQQILATAEVLDQKQETSKVLSAVNAAQVEHACIQYGTDSQLTRNLNRYWPTVLKPKAMRGIGPHR
jgi:hypothetical protein